MIFLWDFCLNPKNQNSWQSSGFSLEWLGGRRRKKMQDESFAKIGHFQSTPAKRRSQDHTGYYRAGWRRAVWT